MASFPNDDKHDTSPGDCCTPASWADTSSLTWRKSLQHHLATYLSSPRMWPIGYIVQSPYSPLRLEMEMPERTCWRDAFEDLLALESGGQMISLESRKKEAEVAKLRWHDAMTSNISSINDILQMDAKYIFKLKQLKESIARKHPAKVKRMVEVVRAQEKSTDKLIAKGKGLVKTHKKLMSNSYPASQYKMRGQWMASLVSSGALPGWGVQIFNSSVGLGLNFVKKDQVPSGLKDRDGQSMTEHDLVEHFEEGVPLPIRWYGWSTAVGPYPGWVQERVNFGPSTVNGMRRVSIPRSSIMRQSFIAKHKRSAKDGLSIEVDSVKEFANGSRNLNVFVDSPIKVLEKNAEVYASMTGWNDVVEIERKKLLIDMASKALGEDEEDDETN